MHSLKKSFVVFIASITLSLCLFTFLKSSALNVSGYHNLETCKFYKWYDPNTNDKEAVAVLKNCANCHMAYYKEWTSDKHSMSKTNPFFLSIYSGTDIKEKENIYPGFKLDHPKQNGNCSFCHNPEAALDNNFDIDLRTAKNTNGISCNFCHKIESIDENTLKQGVRGLKVPRVCEGEKDIGFGPLNDIVESTDVVKFHYNPLYKKSLYCAKCHDGYQGNTQIYSTYTEWLNSPANKKGKQCQSCHMPARGTKEIIDNPDVEHKIRPHSQIHNHMFLTENPHEFRKKFLDLTMKAEIKNNVLKATAKIINKNTGHSFPTGSPMRNAILVLEAKDKKGQDLKLIKGPRLPLYAGSLKERPGKLFAKILSETSSQYAQVHGEGGIKFRKIADALGIPAEQWWNVFISSDTRIKAKEEDVSVYEFAVEPNQKISIKAKLIWRNTWENLAKLKGFKLMEDVITEKTISLND